MNVESVEVAFLLPRTLWEQLQDYAQTEQAEETRLLIEAIEQFLRKADTATKTVRQPNEIPAVRRTSAMGKYANVPGSTEGFMQAKQVDIANEDSKYKTR